MRKFSLIFGFVLSLASTLQAGYEIADLTDAWEDAFRGYTRVYLDFGENRISDEAWPGFVPPTGYLKNSPRNGLFNAENTFSSPGMPSGNVIVENIGGYTWKFIAQIQSAMWPYDLETFPGTINAYQAAFTTVTPPAGSIKFSSNEKNQEMIFWAREGNTPEGAPILRYVITDTWGNQYLMGASGAFSNEEILTSFNNAQLPAGWTKSTLYLPETLSLMPAYGPGNQAHYNLFRENSDNTFFQFVWGEDGGSIAAQIAGMPIWGGGTDDNLRARDGDDNHIYGGGGIDTAILTGNFSDYTLLTWLDGGAELSLSGLDSTTKYLYGISFLQFDDMLLSTATIPETSAALLLLTSLFAIPRRKRHK